MSEKEMGSEHRSGDRLAPGEHIFHIATVEDWQRAQRAGDYRISTLGRSLADEGFIHASRSHQLAGVRAAFYTDPGLRLVVLEIDPAHLDVGLLLEVPPGADEAFPHIYGPLLTDAVVAVRDLSECSQWSEHDVQTDVPMDRVVEPLGERPNDLEAQ